MIGLRRLVRREDGAAAVEFALIGMLLILVSVGTIEVGRALFMYNELAHAADRAARLVMIDSDVAAADLLDHVRDEDLLTGLSPGLLSVTDDDGSPLRTIELSYPFTPMVTGLTIGSFTISTNRRVPST